MKKRIWLGVIGLAVAALPALSADVKQNWDKYCGKCHGPDGQGQTKMGKQTGAKNYTDPKVQAEITDEKALKSIKEGLVIDGKKKMDPYSEKLSDDEIKALLAHIRAFGKK